MSILPIGTRVRQYGRTNREGTVIAHRPQGDDCSYLTTERGSSLLPEVPPFLLDSVFYPASRYPMVVRFDDGYEDVYGVQSFEYPCGEVL